MQKLKYIAMISFVLITSAKPAFAYLDPGTGTAILQGLLAAIAALAVVIKLYWHRFLKIFKFKKENPEENVQNKLEE